MASAGSAYVKTIGRFEIFADDDHILGTGATGTVYTGIDPSNDDNPVAAKKLEIYKEYLNTGEYEKEAELLLHKIPPHENIIKVHEFTKKEYMRGRTAMVDLWLVMDLCEHGSMDVFAESQTLTEQQKLDIMYQSSLAVEHLHKNDVTHRDIKPKNILLTGDDKKPVVKLADFGAARIVERVAGKSLTLHSLAGTDGYMAPEQLNLKDGTFHYDYSVDVFSLGLSHLSLLESRKGSLMSVLTVDDINLGRAMWIKQQQYGSKWSGFVPNIAKPNDSPLATAIKIIIKKMIQTEPTDRIKISEVVQRLAALRTHVTHDREKEGPDVRPKTQSSSMKTPMSSTSSTQPARSANVKSKNEKDTTQSDTRQKAAVRSQTPGDTKQSDTRQKFKAAVRSETPGDSKQTTTASGRPQEAVKSNKASTSSDSSTSAKKVPSHVTSGDPASVQRITRHNLRFTACLVAGLGEHGDIVLADDHRVYKMTHNGQEYSQTLNMGLPEGMDGLCNKAVDANHRTLLQADKEDSDTVCYNDAGKEMYRLKHKGRLINSVGGELFYRREIPGTYDWKIQVHRATTPASASRQEGTSTGPVTLQPPAPHRWGWHLSVCRVQNGYAVTEHLTYSLDIFTTEGRHTLHVKLPYGPSSDNAIASCPSGHLLIAQYDPPAIIHIHELSGREVGRFTRRDLQLKKDVWVHGIYYSREDGLLHLCAGDRYGYINSLHAYRVLFK